MLSLADSLEEAVGGLKTSSKKAVDAFVAKRRFDGDTLLSDGRTLVQIGMGGHKLAVWRGDGKAVFVGDGGTVFQDRVVRYLTKKLPKGKLVFDYNIAFETGGDSYYAGQYDGWIVARAKDGRVVGRLDWSVFNNEYRVKMVEVHPDFRRTGVATQLYRELFRTQKIRSSQLGGTMRTPEGDAFRRGARL